MTPEQKQLEQIEGRLAAHKQEIAKYRNHEWAKGDALHYYEAPADIEFLLSLVKSQEADDSESLHLAICQAVHLMNQGDLHTGHDLLRQTLIDYADKQAPLTRSAIVRQQQRGGSGEITAVMISPSATDEAANEVESLSIEQPKE